MVVVTKEHKIITLVIKKITVTLNLNLMMCPLMTLYSYLEIHFMGHEKKNFENGLISGFHHKTFCIL